MDNKKIAICIIDKKAELLNELESLGINKAKIYPEIDDVADYIKLMLIKLYKYGKCFDMKYMGGA